MRLFDTMTRSVRELSPRDGTTYRFYCCGPTVYGAAHIGNFRTFVLQDVFRRTLELSGIKTFHVRNLTDVDDKTIRDSQAAGQSLNDFTNVWRDRFQDDCRRLNLLEPAVEPSAVEHIPHQIGMIETLIDAGHAYASDDGSVYFRVASFDGYGRLSRLDQREIRHGASAAVSADEYEKDSIADFVLWKARRPEDGPNFWSSPWGDGRPGWHLECSAMCREYLGNSFDLHSGGVDLMFPHHENEIAQSEACTGHVMADHWFHLTHLLVDGGKMSKSAGNFYTLDQIENAGFRPAELRYVLIAAHYRQPLNFVARDEHGAETFPALSGARQALLKIAKMAESLSMVSGAPALEYEAACKWPITGPFAPALTALADDLNTPDALGQMFTTFRNLKPGEMTAASATEAWHGLQKLLFALGLELPQAGPAEDTPLPDNIAALAEARWQAKLAKNWNESDRLRDAVLAEGWEIKDTKEGYTLCPKA
jgi:cysteinyl-tRNA synthetase